MDAFHRQHRDVRGGQRCPCCNSDTKPMGNRMARARLRAETREETDDWLDQPLTPEESATIRERLHGPMMPLPDEPPCG